MNVTIPGKPIPCPRPRVHRGGAHYPESYVQWSEAAKVLMRDAQVKEHGGRLFEGDVYIECVFFGAHRSADLDNLVKSLMDAAQGQVFVNDRQVVDIHAQKQTGKLETWVSMWEVLGE